MGPLGPFRMVTVQRKETSQCLVRGTREDLGEYWKWPGCLFITQRIMREKADGIFVVVCPELWAVACSSSLGIGLAESPLN